MAGNQGAPPRSVRGLFREAPAAALLATWFGSGFLPLAPGTWGSLLAIPFIEASFRLAGLAGLAAFAAAVSAAGIPAAGVVVRLRGEKDPSIIVIDEVAGQAVALLPVYALARAGTPGRFWAFAGAAFVLFRVVDVLKPGPVGRAERLPGGFGVMADDLLGGLLVAVLLGTVLILLR